MQGSWNEWDYYTAARRVFKTEVTHKIVSVLIACFVLVSVELHFKSKLVLNQKVIKVRNKGRIQMNPCRNGSPASHEGSLVACYPMNRKNNHSKTVQETAKALCWPLGLLTTNISSYHIPFIHAASSNFAHCTLGHLLYDLLTLKTCVLCFVLFGRMIISQASHTLFLAFTTHRSCNQFQIDPPD